MIVFSAETNEVDPVYVGTVKDREGDVALKVNGITVLWLVAHSGKILRAAPNKEQQKQLRELGFALDNLGMVALEGE